MENNVKFIESLVESTYDYGKSSYELIKLNAVDKTSDVVSSLIPHSIVFVILVLFTLFFNLGLSFWLGEIVGNNYYGFFIVAAFYLIVGLVIHIFVHKWFKKKLCNYLIKQLLK